MFKIIHDLIDPRKFSFCRYKGRLHIIIIASYIFRDVYVMDILKPRILVETQR